MSYALYLLPLPIRGVIRDARYGPSHLPTIGGSELPGPYLFYARSLIASFAAALVIWRVLEKRVLRLKRFFPMSGSGRTGGAE